MKHTNKTNRLALLLTALALFLILAPQPTQAIDKPGAISLKMLGTEAMDASIKFGVSRQSFSYSLGFGTLLGSKTFNPNAQGYSGSGLNYSGFSTLGNSWLGLRQTLAAGQVLAGNSYGKNGINAELSGLLGKTMTYGAAYSGQNNMGAIYFGNTDKAAAPIGSTLLSGKGYLISKENKFQEGRVDLELKF